MISQPDKQRDRQQRQRSTQAKRNELPKQSRQKSRPQMLPQRSQNHENPYARRYSFTATKSQPHRKNVTDDDRNCRRRYPPICLSIRQTAVRNESSHMARCNCENGTPKTNSATTTAAAPFNASSTSVNTPADFPGASRHVRRSRSARTSLPNVTRLASHAQSNNQTESIRAGRQ